MNVKKISGEAWYSPSPLPSSISGFALDLPSQHIYLQQSTTKSNTAPNLNFLAFDYYYYYYYYLVRMISHLQELQ